MIAEEQKLKGTLSGGQSLTGSMKDIPSLDKTLTKEGYAADSKAVGDALKEKAPTIHQHTKEDITNFPTSLPASDVYNWAKQPQKPSYTASEVKARPNTWMPTAEQVGARPNTWMPSATDVGAHPNTWLPTIAQIGAAPSGYGLGEYPSTVITNPDTITKSGFYKAVCNFSEYYQNITAWVEMIASSESYATQHAYFDMHEGVRLTRYKIAGAWQPWEWNNPPMGIGIEFRTTERFNGKPVYTVAFNMGMASDNKMVSYPIEGDRFIIRGLASCDGHPLPYNGTSRQDDTYMAVDFAKYEAYIRTNSYNAGKTVYAQVWYVKGAVE